MIEKYQDEIDDIKERKEEIISRRIKELRYCLSTCSELSPTEEQQDKCHTKGGRRNPHLCAKYKKNIKHIDSLGVNHHPELVRLEECNLER